MGQAFTKLDGSQILLEVSKDLFEIDAIILTTHKFSDRCHIRIEKTSPAVISVYLKLKNEMAITLQEFVDNFWNELLDQQVRLTVERNFGDIRNEIVKKAFSSFD